jgi:hypothetical protein
MDTVHRLSNRGQLLAHRLDRIEGALALRVQRHTAKDWDSMAEAAHIFGKAEFMAREWCRRGRVHALDYDPSDAMLGALTLYIADRGWPFIGTQEISPHETREVAYFLIGEILRFRCCFDLSLFVNKALPDFLQWQDGETKSDWRDLVTVAIEEHLVAVRHPDERPSRADRKQIEHVLLREILRQHTTREGQERVWSERTGKSGAWFLPAVARA